MNKKEKAEFIKWVNSFTGKIITKGEVYKNYGKKKKRKKVSGYYIANGKVKVLYEKKR